MAAEFDLQAYLTAGVEKIVAGAVRATLRNPKESAFMLKFAAAARAASGKRRKAETQGEHIPPFLI
ncbi:MAG: radical SAM protein, partial [Oscillospiraceae bacterium]|nr:radical SAM protein [Oscillospiraceae bacterium]